MTEGYVLGNLDNEIARLEIQSAFFEPMTRQTLLRAGIKKGMSCLDVGCGAGSVTRILAELVGKKGHVIGTDVDEKYLRYCRNYKPQPNVDFMRDDIYNSRLGENFDVIYSRFMFVHLKNARKAIRSMKLLVKNGGAIIIEELDHAPDSWLCYPESKSVDILREIYVALVKKAGGDPIAGRKIYTMMVEESLDARVECNSPCLLMGHEPYNSLGWRIAESLKPQIQSYGLLSEQEYVRLYNELKQLSTDKKSFITYARFFSIIGRK
ncbi:MAG TPA: methyltransferase domain-containing protein [Nitrososphaera sp.]|nr:methyltransferase domain-containing protein [Nitrososphaera sp.]